MQRSLAFFAMASTMAFLGCASSAQAKSCPESPVSQEEPAVNTTPSHRDPVATPESAPSVSPVVTSEPEAKSNETSALPEAEEKPIMTASSNVPSERAEALPELKLKLSGMHIGGGPNDAATKKPFIDAIEAGFERMRVCYQKAENPTKGGTFGVDLRVDRQGGNPTLQAVRTVMKGDAMRACLEKVFRELEFAKPTKPTVLSASVYFELKQ
jgi:hypothetical protein